MRKSISLILAAVMLVCVIPFSASAEKTISGTVYSSSFSNGDSIVFDGDTTVIIDKYTEINSLTGENGSLTVKGDGSGQVLRISEYIYVFDGNFTYAEDSCINVLGEVYVKGDIIGVTGRMTVFGRVRADKNMTLTASYLEIYNEEAMEGLTVYDCLRLYSDSELIVTVNGKESIITAYNGISIKNSKVTAKGLDKIAGTGLYTNSYLETDKSDINVSAAKTGMSSLETLSIRRSQVRIVSGGCGISSSASANSIQDSYVGITIYKDRYDFDVFDIRKKLDVDSSVIFVICKSDAEKVFNDVYVTGDSIIRAATANGKIANSMTLDGPHVVEGSNDAGVLLVAPSDKAAEFVVSFKEPSIGGIPDTKAQLFTFPTDAKDTIEIELVWYESETDYDGDIYPMESSVFEEGKYYYAVISEGSAKEMTNLKNGITLLDGADTSPAAPYFKFNNSIGFYDDRVTGAAENYAKIEPMYTYYAISAAEGIGIYDNYSHWDRKPLSEAKAQDKVYFVIEDVEIPEGYYLDGYKLNGVEYTVDEAYFSFFDIIMPAESIYVELNFKEQTPFTIDLTKGSAKIDRYAITAIEKAGDDDIILHHYIEEDRMHAYDVDHDGEYDIILSYESGEDILKISQFCKITGEITFAVKDKKYSPLTIIFPSDYGTSEEETEEETEAEETKEEETKDAETKAEETKEDNKENEILPGDVNGDGDVDNKDVVLLFRYVSGSGTEIIVSAADINGDETVDNKDVVMLFRSVSGNK